MQICFFLFFVFRRTAASFLLWNFLPSIETLMRIPLKPRKKISSVWIFLKVEESSGLLGSLEIINIDGASPTSQPLWGQFMQKEGQYLNLGKVTIKPRGIFRPHHLTRSFLIPAVWYWNYRQERNFNTMYINVDQYRRSEYSDGLSLVCIWCK